MKWLIGVDEVGRGCLAGPVMVGVFAILEKDVHMLEHADVRDSKVVSAARRQRAFEHLDSVARGGHARYAVTMQSAQVIDEIGIVGAIRLCVAEGLAAVGLAPSNTHVYLDGGLYAPSEWKYQSSHTKGDRDYRVISAASVIAKVVRDEYMVSCACDYSSYGWEHNKGYGTIAHRIAIAQFGSTAQHRKLFLRNIMKSLSTTSE